MVDPPQRLLEPRLLGRVAAYHFRRACATVGPLRVRTKARA